jgi:uncharacterized protein YcbX
MTPVLSRVTLASIALYPIKSARGTLLTEAHIERRGLRHDRRFMIVDEHSSFITQRTHPTLALVVPTIDGDTLRIDAPSMPTLRVPLELREGARRDVVVWKSTCAALSAGDEAARWLEGYLGAPYDLVFMPDATERKVNPEYARPGDVVSFADGYPVLIATTASLDDLNARMPSALLMNRFRPNLVITGTAAWDEDAWTHVTIGEVPMRIPKPCDRCLVTTVDQATGEKGDEPLRTLATFRKRDHKVYFGQNAIPDADGIVRVGDAVSITP